ncbi:uncharacterized protein LOC125189804 [Salvia hispanica]|uniref:uncharacterized protein LOC125189804 n=1 Tax=Salvia hispanica TaxID=49212 RepID=UPI002009D63D|nr:uncharacterized protein LOC125189804 [Salvia hispanica]
MDDLWNQAWDSLIQEVQREADEEAAAAAAAAIPREIRHRRTIPRDHVGVAERLMADYFSADPRYPAEIFRRRFRMSRPLFTHIATTLADRFECFTLRSDCTGRIGLSTLRNAPLQLGNLPMPDRLICSNNDINVLQSSPIFNDECRGEGPQISFVANGTQYRRGYYLADGIYPRWPVFVKTLRQAAGAKRQYFARKQEAARKDVERAFGVLQARWAILRCPARVWHEDDVADIMVACIILHNMIIEDEGFAVERWAPEDGASTSHGVPPRRYRWVYHVVMNI